MTKNIIGIIGGSGLYNMDGLKVTGEKVIETPFGMPSDAVVLGTLDGAQVAFIPRHGKGHRILPHEINYRANIYALKVLGVREIISVSAVGSMREDIHPGDLVIVDQFVDRTKMRVDSFFGDGIVAHASFADPVCMRLRKIAADAAKKIGANVHDGGTYICIEGPMFSSRAESNIYRTWCVDVIGMTNYQEAKLAREAEMCYTTIALTTDYDCWHMEEEIVDVEMVLQTMKDNVTKAQTTIREMIHHMAGDGECKCQNALKGAIMTDRSMIPADVKKRLEPIIGKYLK